jgi:hypothetical protein
MSTVEYLRHADGTCEHVPYPVACGRCEHGDPYRYEPGILIMERQVCGRCDHPFIDDSDLVTIGNRGDGTRGAMCAACSKPGDWIGAPVTEPWPSYEILAALYPSRPYRKLP